MNARRVAAAAGVVFAAQKTRQTATGIATALEAACMLQSPETAAEQLALLAEVDKLRLRVAELAATLSRIGARAEQRHLVDELDHALEHLADNPPAEAALLAEIVATDDDRRTKSVSRLRTLLARQSEGARKGACSACGDIPAEWCPDCAACRKGCYGGHDDNTCTHPNAPWATTPMQSGGAQ